MQRLAATLAALAVVPLWCAAGVCSYAQIPLAEQSKAEAQIPSTSVPVKMDRQQARILADTKRLRKLSQELKTEVDKSSKETLSVSVIQKAQEVEKLARSLKEEISKSH